MILRFLALFFIIQTVNGYAQIVVSNNPPMNTEEYIVNNVLLGDDLNTSNYTSVGFANGIGYFDGFNSNIGFDEGVVLSTGGIEFDSNGFGAGTGVSGDSDLELALNAINLNWVTLSPINNAVSSSSATTSKENPSQLRFIN